MVKILENEYWVLANNLLPQLVDNDYFIDIGDDLKKEIGLKIINSCENNNYLISKLLIYGDIDEETLLNFLLYTTLNNKIYYELFCNKPDKYGSTFMFPIILQQLPKIQNIFSQNDYYNLAQELNVSELVSNIRRATLKELKKLFKTTYNFSKINPYSIKVE